MKKNSTKSIYKRWTTDGVGYFLAMNIDDAKSYAEKINVDPNKVQEVVENG